MNTMLKLLGKIFIVPFYTINAGFFLFAFILIFGIVFPPQLILLHRSLINGIIHSNVFTLAVLLLWLMYNLKCIFFCLRIIDREEDTILFNLQVMSPATQWILFFMCHVILYLPVLIYSCFVVAASISNAFLVYALALILFQLSMCAIAVYLYYYRINFKWKTGLLNGRGLSVLPLFTLKKKLSLYLVYYTFQSRKILFFILKCTSLFLLNIILASNKDQFLIREFILVFMIVILIHSLLVYYYVGFMERSLSFSRNLPISRMQRFLLFLFAYSLMLLPEFFFIITNGSRLISVQAIVLFYGIAVAELLLFTSALYLIRMKMKPYLQMIFCIYLLFSILTLSGYYIGILLSNLALALIIFYSKFYKYEVEV